MRTNNLKNIINIVCPYCSFGVISTANAVKKFHFIVYGGLVGLPQSILLNIRDTFFAITKPYCGGRNNYRPSTNNSKPNFTIVGYRSALQINEF